MVNTRSGARAADKKAAEETAQTDRREDLETVEVKTVPPRVFQGPAEDTLR